MKPSDGGNNGMVWLKADPGPVSEGKGENTSQFQNNWV